MLRTAHAYSVLFLSGLVLIASVAFFQQSAAQDASKGKFDPKTDEPIIDMFRKSPDAIPLDPRDPTKDLLGLYRDPNDNPKREPGPINIQKTVGHSGRGSLK